MELDLHGLQGLSMDLFLERIHSMPLYEAIEEVNRRREITMMQIAAIDVEKHNLVLDGGKKGENKAAIKAANLARMAVCTDLASLSVAHKTLVARREEMSWQRAIESALGPEALLRVKVWRARDEFEHRDPEKAERTREFIERNGYLSFIPWTGG